MNMKASQRPGVRFVEGMPLSVPNTTYDGDGFYVSHNSRDIGIYGAVTTALVTQGQRTEFYILKGDHRKNYEPLMELGFDACMKYFVDNISQIARYSDRPETGATGAA